MKLEERSERKTKTGVVVSNKMDKTVVVQVKRTMQHPQYGKVINRAKKYYAHNEMGEIAVGDTVEIMETRPISRLKRWRVVAKVS